jgi:hypothetical protein
MAQRLQHILALGLGVDGIPALQIPDGLVRAETKMDFAISRGLFEETDVAAVQHVKTAADKNLFPAHKFSGTTGSENISSAARCFYPRNRS